MKKILYLIPLFFLLTCCSSSKKEKEIEKQRKRDEARREQIIEENKYFEFLCELVTYKTGISQDIVIIVAKEYCKQYEDAVFKGNKIIDINYNSTISEPEYYNFVENVIKQYQLPRKEVFLIFHEINSYYVLMYMENAIYDIDACVYNISEKTDN